MQKHRRCHRTARPILNQLDGLITVLQIMIKTAQDIFVFLENRINYDKIMTQYLNQISIYVYLFFNGFYFKTALKNDFITKTPIKKY